MTASPGDRFAVNTYAYTQDMAVLECLSSLADQGYRAFELMVYPGHLWPADLDQQARRTIRSTMDQRGLRLISLNMPNVDINIAGASFEMREYSLRLMEGFLDLAGDLGAEGIVMGPGKPNPLFPARHDTMMGHFFRAPRFGSRTCRLPSCPTSTGSSRPSTDMAVRTLGFVTTPRTHGLSPRTSAMA